MFEMAHGHHDTGVSWEWDSMLLLSNPSLLTSPSSESNGTNSSGLREPFVSAATSSADRHQFQDRRTLKTSADHIRTDSHPAQTQQKQKDRHGEKRDPRLDCPNFLAGRVPCACTDNDDDDSGVSRKRAKPVPRCQVQSCGADLTDLKGYHQRHRVCLRCAHATRVILREQPHRYCQQCGKFHPICDFDEGKRSCRRKLERHNNRRRRKAGEDGFPALDSGDGDLQNENSPADGTSLATKSDLLSEGEPNPLRGVNSSFGGEQTLQTSRISSNDEVRMISKVSETSTLLGSLSTDIPLHTLEASATTNLEGSGITAEPLKHLEVSQPLEQQFGQVGTCCLAEHVPFGLEARSDSLTSTGPDDFSLHTSTHLPAAEGGQSRRGNDEQSLLALLMEENGDTEESRPSENAGGQLISSLAQMWDSCPSPKRLYKNVAYSSPLPTGRISFKLYDWNPGDFPRQLRQQVMEWLSNMPVDLEGYIRSGCTILTIFIAMPQQGWHKLNADWAGSVLKLVRAEQSSFPFWSSGYLIARMDDHVVHINNGELAYPLSENLRVPPTLHSVSPLCVEAGCETEVVILGHNLQQPCSRLLVSFDGKYIINGAYQSSSQAGGRGPISKVDAADNAEDAKVIVSMPALSSQTSGTAYVEIEWMAGTSNYIPLLVAEKEIVDEVRSLEKEMERRTSCCSPDINRGSGFPHLSQGMVHNLLLDLGWVLKNVSSKALESDFRVEILDLHLERLRRLLFFGVERSWCCVVERVLQLANRSGVIGKIGVLENGLSALHVAILQHKVNMVEHLISCAESLSVSSQCTCWWNLDFPGPEGLTPLHLAALQPRAYHLHHTLLKKKGTASNGNGLHVSPGWTPHEAAAQGQELCCRIEISNSLHEDNPRAVGINAMAYGVHGIQSEMILSNFGGEESIHNLLPSGGKVGAQKVVKRTVNVPVRGKLPRPCGNFGFDGLNMYMGRNRKRSFQLLSSLSVVLLCAGVCIFLQCPDVVILLSLNLQQCVWGLANESQ